MHITIIEEEKILSSKISKILKINWFNTQIFNTHTDFKNKSSYISDLFIIDITSTEFNWFDIITYLRNTRKIISPIIITSAHNDSHKKAFWLNLWADDYLVKPYCENEFMARIRALIRRSHNSTNNSILKYKNLEYNLLNKILIKDWEEIQLTANEVKLIELLLFNLWKVISKLKLINSVWWEYELKQVSDNTINVTISRIRKKLWIDFDFKTLINKWYILEE